MSASISSDNLQAAASSNQRLQPELLAAQSLLMNMDPRNLVEPLRVAQASRARLPDLAEETAKEIQVALHLQQDWDAWLAQRELLRIDAERGRDCLAQSRRELEELRWKLEHWPAYERTCGHNPLAQYLQAIDARERIEKFLPCWIERCEDQLATLTSKMEACARQNGLEHLL
jgi:hypothetical protein